MRGRCIGCMALVSTSAEWPRVSASPSMEMMSGFMKGSPPVKPISRAGTRSRAISSRKRKTSARER